MMKTRQLLSELVHAKDGGIPGEAFIGYMTQSLHHHNARVLKVSDNEFHVHIPIGYACDGMSSLIKKAARRLGVNVDIGLGGIVQLEMGLFWRYEVYVIS
jgi:hypothetical protein